MINGPIFTVMLNFCERPETSLPSYYLGVLVDLAVDADQEIAAVQLIEVLADIGRDEAVIAFAVHRQRR